MSNTNPSTTEFALSCVNDALPYTPYDKAELLRAVMALTHWSERHGIQLTRASVLGRDNIVAHIATGLSEYGQATRTNRRSQLFRVAEALLGPALAPRPLPALAGSDPTAPYTEHEQALLLNWARREKKEKNTDDAMVLLALGLGAGLSAQEVMDIRTPDIIEEGRAVLVRVRNARTRIVPVLERWENTLTRRAASLEPGDFLFKPSRTGAGKNLISNFVARSKTDGVHAQTQRLRSTWLVAQMTACTPLPELVEAAGVDSLEALTRYLQFVPARTVSEGVAVLRAA